MPDSNNERYPGLHTKHNEAAALVAQMSLEERANFCSGRDFWHLETSERLGIPPVMLTDGPHGLRKQAANGDHVGLHSSVPATCFPTACALASSWDTDLLHQVGVALGQECVAENVAVLLGPGVNIKRHPLCGRNFEYFSEDPLLTGCLAAAFINGVQSQKVGTSIKHYALNNQEHHRMQVNVIADERTIREIYLRGFEIAVKAAQPWTVMCSYNRVNGTYASEHDWLLNKVLRDEWGFEGLVVTDWGAANDRVKGIAAGLDLEMPASGGVNDRRLYLAVDSDELPTEKLDQAVTRIVSLSLLGGELQGRNQQVDWQAHHDLARKAALESAVLLKNDQCLLPLRKETKIAVIGEFAKQPRYQGTGSSRVNPHRLDNAYDALEEYLGSAPVYAKGYCLHETAENSTEQGDQLIAEAVGAARGAEVVLLFAGLPATYESEGFDRADMQMPMQQCRLIEAVCDANPNTAVLLFNGGPVEMPWVDKVAAVLEMYLPGQAGGSAAVGLLYGHACPSGKLAETFPMKLSDVPSDQWFPGDGRQVQYREGLYVGYRFFDMAGVSVLFPFGHGLSYTQFGYTGLRVSEAAGQLTCSVQLTNQGDRTGAEVVQLYVRKVDSAVRRPEQELKAFAKIMLAPGESATVLLNVDLADLAIYDIGHDSGQGAWVVEPGEYEIRVGASSQDIRLKHPIKLVGPLEQLSRAFRDAFDKDGGPAIRDGKLLVDDKTFAAMLGHPLPAAESVRPYHLNTSLGDLGGSMVGRLLMNRAMARFRQDFDVEERDGTTARMFEEMARTMPLRSMVLFSRGRLSFRLLGILLALMNHRYLEAMRLLLGGRGKWA